MSSMKAIYEVCLFLMHPKYEQIHKIQCLHKATLHTFLKGDRGSTCSVEVCASQHFTPISFYSNNSKQQGFLPPQRSWPH